MKFVILFYKHVVSNTIMDLITRECMNCKNVYQKMLLKVHAMSKHDVMNVMCKHN